MASKAEQRKEQFIRQYELAKRYHDKLKEEWKRYDAVYHGKKEFPKQVNDLLRSRLRIPWAWQQVETIIPRIMDPDPKFDFQPVERDDANLSEALNALSRYQLNKDRFVQKQRSFVQDGCVFGLAVAKVVWRQKTQTLRVRRAPDPSQAVTGPQVEEKTVLVENRPSIIYVNPHDFLWDPKATNDQDWEYVFHVSWLSTAQLKQRQKIGVYKNVDKIGDNDTWDPETRSLYEASEEAEARRKDRHKVVERWHADGTVMVMCGDTVLRDDPNPFFHGDIPFAVFRSQPTPLSLVGVSEIEKIAHIQEAVWTRDNQRIDAVSLALNQILILDPTIKGVRDLKFQPGAKIYANQGQRVDQLRLDPLQTPAFNETEAYLGAMQQMTGASPYLAGSDPSYSGINQSTATGAQILQEEGNKRMYMKKLEFQLFEARIAKLMTQLNHQYLTPAEIRRIIGDDADGYKVPTPEEIPMFLDVMPEGMSDSSNRIAEMNGLNEILMSSKDLHGTMMPDGSGNMVMFSVRPFIEDIIKLKGKDPRRAFVPAPPPPPMEQGEQPQ